MINRRRFLRLIGAAALSGWGAGQLRAYDWYAETPLAASMRHDLEAVFSGLSMTLDFRCINGHLDEEFRIQINADKLYPVASCFKAFVVLYYFLSMPPEEWDASEYTPLYRMAVYSDNGATGVVLDNLSRRVSGPKNAIEKFNDFLLTTVGIENGLHTWKWEGSPTVGLSDPRFAPSFQRVVTVRGIDYQIDNVFAAADLARGYDFITRGEFFTHSAKFRDAVRATKDLLSISAGDVYRSPIERVYPAGYMGKDGVLPASDVAVGRVIDDAGALKVGNNTYLIAFMSAGDSESTAIEVLREVVRHIDIYEGIEAMTGEAFRDALVKTYLENPCQVLANPLWKTLDKLDDFQTAFGGSDGRVSRLEASNEESIFVFWRREGRQPSLLMRRKLETVRIALMHQDFLDPDVAVGFDTRRGYYRLLHDHKNLQSPQLPKGFRFAEVDTGLELLRAAAFAGQEPNVLQSWVNHSVFAPDLWLWVMDEKTGQPSALGIAELDSTYSEAAIEWIQVLPSHYGETLGQNLVLELLRRVGDRAKFTTISGELDFKERENPGAFYRECGFTGQDVWWLLGR